jgi:hypothetical protein
VLEKTVIARPEKSKFVTVIAIIFMIISVQSILGYLYSLISSPDSFSDMHAQLEGSVISIAFIALFVAAFALSVSTFVACIGLLKRKNWARITFIVNLWIAIVLNIMLVAVLTKLYFSTAQATLSLGVPWLDNLLGIGMQILSAFLFVIYIATLVYAFISSALFGWLIKKFSASNIKAEFGMLAHESNHWSLSS